MFHRILHLNHIIKVLLAFVIIVFLYMIGCSETYFSSLKTVTCDDFTGTFNNTGTSCGRVHVEAPRIPQGPSADPMRRFLEFKYYIPLGKVDIIFVVDNSSSMHEEHTSLAKQFSSFLNEIKYLDYRIAVITTDISSSPDNPVRGAPYQDGKFIPIGGRSFLENSNLGGAASSRAIEDFAKTLVRPETIDCDGSSASGGSTRDDEYFFQYGVDRPRSQKSGGGGACPSHDERGIYALNLAIENYNQRSFFRSGAHLMMVVISDEDERSSYKYISERLSYGENYEFETRDYPEFLVENVYNMFGPLKNFSFHSIIIPPGNSSCYKKQMERADGGSGSGRGFYGVEYAKLSKARDMSLLEYENLLRGNIISICDRGYGNQLGKIALYADVVRAALPCSSPEEIIFQVNGRRSNLKYDIEGRTLIVREGQVSLTAHLELSIICEE